MTPVRFIRMTEVQFERLHSALITPCGREHQAYLLGGLTQNGLVVARVVVPGDDEYDERTATSVVTSPACLLRVARQFQDEEFDFVADCHSHPFTDDAAWFSGTDDRWIVGTRDRTFLRRRPSATFVRFVTGSSRDGFTCQWWDSDDRQWRNIPELQVVGQAGGQTIRSRSHGEAASGEAPLASPLYARSSVLRSEEEDCRVRRARVAVVGAGGIGWELARLVSAMGVQHVTLIDGDQLEPLNLNRLVGATVEDAVAGLPKVDVLARMLRAHDPERVVETVGKPFPSPEAVAAVTASDLVLLGTDSDRARFDGAAPGRPSSWCRLPTAVPAFRSPPKSTANGVEKGMCGSTSLGRARASWTWDWRTVRSSGRLRCVRPERRPAMCSSGPENPRGACRR